MEIDRRCHSLLCNFSGELELATHRASDYYVSKESFNRLLMILVMVLDALNVVFSLQSTVALDTDLIDYGSLESIVTSEAS